MGFGTISYEYFRVDENLIGILLGLLTICCGVVLWRIVAGKDAGDTI